MSPFPVNKNIKVPGEDLGKVGYAYIWWTRILDLKEKTFGISVRFLEVLRAEINGYLQKPNKIKDFPCIDESAKSLDFEIAY